MTALRHALLLLALVLAASARAADIDSLVTGGQLTVDTHLEPAGPLVVGQRARIRIRVATDHWFAGGTRIEVPEVPGLIVMQTEMFAANNSERRGGETWVVQTWSLDVFATAAGTVATGPITLEVQVNSDDGVVKGSLRAPSVSVNAVLPPDVPDSGWLATPELSAEQRYDPDTTSLEPGDAVTRTITLRARDVLEKMLPETVGEATPGLAAYPGAGELTSRTNRGQTTAQRVDQTTYVAEQAGDYVLPDYTFTWWDTDAGELRTTTLEGRTLSVTGSAETAEPPPQSIDWRRALPPLLASLVLGLLALAAWRWLPWSAMARYCRHGWQAAGEAWQRARAPALPDRLNPWRPR